MEGMSRGGASGPGFSGMGGMDPADIFAELFGASMGFGFDYGPSRGPRRTKGQDSHIPYEVTLEDLYNGKTVKMNMEKEVVCGICKGYVIWPPSEYYSGNKHALGRERRGMLNQNPVSSARGRGGQMSRHR